MAVSLGFAAAGLALLFIAADHLIVGAGRLAARLGVSSILVGVVVIGFGTSAPELVVAASAALADQGGMAAAALVGSNILNVTLVLGLGGLLGRVMVRSSVLRREAPLSVAAVTAFAVALAAGLAVLSGLLLTVLLVAAVAMMVRRASRDTQDVLAEETEDYLDEEAGLAVLSGLLLTVLLVAALAMMVRRASRDTHDVLAEETEDYLDEEAGPEPATALGDVLRTVFGLAGTLVGAQLLVTGAADMAARAGVPQEVIGFTLIAVGTSLPELVTTAQAARRGEADLMVGNVLGSNLVNSLAGGALVGLLSQVGTTALDPVILLAMVGAAGLSWALLARGRRLTRPESVLLLAGYLALLPFLS